MIFAFLYGLSMDYEVFMVSRMREAYDETGKTKESIALGLARTGKLVTSAALVLMFAFFVLSTEPRHGHQAVRDRARGRDHLRRHRDPGAARALDHVRGRALELVAAPARRPGASRAAGPAGTRTTQRPLASPQATSVRRVPTLDVVASARASSGSRSARLRDDADVGLRLLPAVGPDLLRLVVR